MVLNEKTIVNGFKDSIHILLECLFAMHIWQDYSAVGGTYYGNFWFKTIFSFPWIHYQSKIFELYFVF